MTDHQRQDVYDWELTFPFEPSHSELLSIEQCGEIAVDVWESLGIGSPPPTTTPIPGEGSSFFHNGVIHLSETGRCQWVVMHELAHAIEEAEGVSAGREIHGARFLTHYLYLLIEHLGIDREAVVMSALQHGLKFDATALLSSDSATLIKRNSSLGDAFSDSDALNHVSPPPTQKQPFTKRKKQMIATITASIVLTTAFTLQNGPEAPDKLEEISQAYKLEEAPLPDTASGEPSPQTSSGARRGADEEQLLPESREMRLAAETRGVQMEERPGSDSGARHAPEDDAFLRQIRLELLSYAKQASNGYDAKKERVGLEKRLDESISRLEALLPPQPAKEESPQAPPTSLGEINPEEEIALTFEAELPSMEDLADREQPPVVATSSPAQSLMELALTDDREASSPPLETELVSPDACQHGDLEESIRELQRSIETLDETVNELCRSITRRKREPKGGQKDMNEVAPPEVTASKLPISLK